MVYGCALTGDEGSVYMVIISGQHGCYQFVYGFVHVVSVYLWSVVSNGQTVDTITEFRAPSVYTMIMDSDSACAYDTCIQGILFMCTLITENCSLTTTHSKQHNIHNY